MSVDGINNYLLKFAPTLDAEPREPTPLLPQSEEEEEEVEFHEEFAKLFAMIGLKDSSLQRATDEAAKKVAHAKKIDQACANVLHLTGTFCRKDSDSLLSPHPQLLQKHDSQTASWLINSCLKSIPQAGDKETTKLELYVNLLLILDKELEYLMALKDAVDARRLLHTLEGIIFETAPTKFAGNMFFAEINPKWDLRTTEGYAFYLRFTQKLQKEKEGQTSALTEEERAVFLRLLTSGDPSVAAQTAFFAVNHRRSEVSEKVGELQTACERILADINRRLECSNIQAIYKWITPAFGFLLSVDLERLKVLSHNGNYDHKNNKDHTHYSPLFDRFLGSILPHYLEKQALIYNKCYDYLQALVKANPSCQNALNAVRTPEAYFQVKQSFLKSFKTEPPKPKSLSDEALALLLTEKSKKVPASAPKKTKKNKAKVPQDAVPSQPPAPQEAKPCPPPAQVSLFTKPGALSWHQRIKRWMYLDSANFMQIRQFADKRDGQIVLLYEKLPEDELRNQFFFHGFSRLVDKILVDESMRKKYCLATDRGSSLFVEVICPSHSPKKAIISYGLDKAFCFHRMIEFKDESDFHHHPLAALAAQSQVAPSADDEAILLEELTSDFIGDDAIFDPNLEIIKVIDKKHGYQINIFPLN